MRSERRVPSARTGGHLAPERPRTSVASNDEEISTIRAGQGARVTTRKNAAQAAKRARKNAEKRYLERHPEARAPEGGPERSGKNVVILVVLAVLALALLFLLVRCVATLVAPDPAEQAQQAMEQARDEQNLSSGEDVQKDAAFDQVAADGTLSYDGDTYTLQVQDDGLWGVVCTDQQGNQTTLFKVEGTPAALARRMSTILVPENRNGGWDVVCYVIDGHADPSYLVGEDGSPVGGSGDVTSIEMGETTMRVSDSTGAVTDVSLV